MTGPSFSSATRAHDNLLAGDFPRVEETVTILSGETRSRGDLLGKVTASGKWVLSLAAASDGSEVPRAILLEDVDASGGDKDGPVARTGEFNEAAVTFGTGHTVASTREGLAEKSIYLKTTVPA